MAEEQHAELVRVTAYDDVRLDFRDVEWPVEAPPFEAPDFRGPWRALQYGALRGAQQLALVLPRPIREVLVRSVACAGRTLDRRHTAAARDFIRTALPGASEAEREALLREAWRHLLRVAILAEGVPRHVLGRRLGDVYEVHAVPEVVEFLERRARGDATGAMMISGHVGVWEAATPGVVGLGFRPAYGVGKAPRNDRVAHQIQRMREAQGMRLVPRNGAMQAVPAAIRAGAFVGMLLDHRPRQTPLRAPFFGRPAGCDRSAGVLLRRVKAPIIFYGCYQVGGGYEVGGPSEAGASSRPGGRAAAADGFAPRPGGSRGQPWRFDLRFTRMVRPEELAGLSPEEVATTVNRELERLVLHRPDQYFWLHDRYKDAPPSEEAAVPADSPSGSPTDR